MSKLPPQPPHDGDGDPNFATKRRLDADGLTTQGALFPSGEFIVPESLRNMRKAVAAIHVLPTRGEATSINGRRLFDACIVVAQIDCGARGAAEVARIKNERISPMFEVSIAELNRLAGIPGKNYERVYAEMERMLTTLLTWNVVGEDAGVEWEYKSHFLSSFGRGRGPKAGRLRFSMEPGLLSLLLEPSNWASLSFQAMRGFKTSASYALYQNTFRYQGTANKITAPLPVEAWVELLVGGKSGYIEQTPEGKRVVRYADFKRRILMDAIRVVNDSPALAYSLELREIRSGKRVARLQFKFVPKTTPTLGIPLVWPSAIVEVLGSLGFAKSDMEAMSQARTYEEVAEAVARLKVAEERLKSQGRPISSRKAYFGGILANIAAGKALQDIDEAALEAETRIREEQNKAEERRKRLGELFSKDVANAFNQALFALPEARRATMLDEFMSTAEGGRARAFLEKKNWSPNNVPALAMLRDWLSKSREDVFRELLPESRHRSFDEWLAWRADNAG